jgi:hypothetical protein
MRGKGSIIDKWLQQDNNKIEFIPKCENDNYVRQYEITEDNCFDT